MYRESRGKQMNKKIRGMAAFQNEEGSYARREPKQRGSVQALARQIYQEKEGDDLDNWLEAEQYF